MLLGVLGVLGIGILGVLGVLGVLDTDHDRLSSPGLKPVVSASVSR